MAKNSLFRVDVQLKDMGVDVQIEELIEAIESNLDSVASFVLDEAKRSSEFIDRTKNLRNSIRKRKSKYPRGGFIIVASGANRTKFKGFHAHLVEFGHVMFLNGKPTGKRVPPHPFLRPAKEKGAKYALKLFRAAVKK